MQSCAPTDLATCRAAAACSSKDMTRGSARILCWHRSLVVIYFCSSSSSLAFRDSALRRAARSIQAPYTCPKCVSSDFVRPDYFFLDATEARLVISARHSFRRSYASGTTSTGGSALACREKAQYAASIRSSAARSSFQSSPSARSVARFISIHRRFRRQPVHREDEHPARLELLDKSVFRSAELLPERAVRQVCRALHFNSPALSAPTGPPRRRTPGPSRIAR